MSLLRTIGTRVPAVAQIEQAIAHPSKRSYEQLRGVSSPRLGLLPHRHAGRSQMANALAARAAALRNNAGEHRACTRYVAAAGAECDARTVVCCTALRRGSDALRVLCLRVSACFCLPLVVCPCLQDLWKARAEYWIRRTQNVPVALRAAKVRWWHGRERQRHRRFSASLALARDAIQS
jgi:hypothetical protein